MVKNRTGRLMKRQTASSFNFFPFILRLLGAFMKQQVVQFELVEYLNDFKRKNKLYKRAKEKSRHYSCFITYYTA